QYLPVIIKASPPAASLEWSQHAHDAMRTSYTEQVVPTPWRWKWSWNGPTAQGDVAIGKFSLPRNSQPVTGGGRVYIAAGSKGVFALNNANGIPVWDRADIGSINSTPAYDPAADVLLVVSANGRLYRLNAASGQTLNQFNAGATSSLPLPPALYGESVYFSMGSNLFALHRSSLAERWRYAAGSPLDTPPAVSPGSGAVIVVSHDLFVHAVNSADGSRRWRVKPTPRQPGNPGGNTNFAEAARGWPVIAEEHGLVLVRYRLDWQTLWNWNPTNLQTNAQMRQFLQANPSQEVLYVLRLSDGGKAFIANVGNGGYGDGDYLPMGPPPVVKRFADGKEVAYVVMRGGPCAQNPCDSRWDSHLGELMLDNSTVSGFTAGEVRYMRNSFFPTDEQAFLSMAGDQLFAAHWEAGIAHQISDRSPDRGASATNPILTLDLPHITTSQDMDVCGSGFQNSHYCASGLQNTRRWSPGFYIYWQQGAVYDAYWSEYAAWVVSNDTIYYVSTDGSLTALQHGSPQPQTLHLNESATAGTPPPVLIQPIPYHQAQRYAGWQAQVEGQLVEVFNNGKAVYLTFSQPHQGEFIVRILKADWVNFAQPPERLYAAGQWVRVRGAIGWYQGGAVIQPTRPEQIEILKAGENGVK
ncbi:MAG: PQQ-binding-like beta-propeller repeat protein, partial [Chloroflexota bacterium]